MSNVSKSGIKKLFRSGFCKLHMAPFQNLANMKLTPIFTSNYKISIKIFLLSIEFLISYFLVGNSDNKNSLSFFFSLFSPNIHLFKKLIHICMRQSYLERK